MSVDQGSFSMEKLVSNVSMVKYGMNNNLYASVKMDINGMETFVKNSKDVQEEEFGTVHMSNVYVLMIMFGLETIVN